MPYPTEGAVIGASYEDRKLVLTMRNQAEFTPFEQHENIGPAASADAIVRTLNAHWRLRPMVYVAGDGAQPLIEALNVRRANGGERIAATEFQWLTPLEKETRFANKGSQAFADVVKLIKYREPRDGDPLGDPSLLAEADLFARDESTGVTVYPSPFEVAKVQGTFPDRMIAIVCATQTGRDVTKLDNAGGGANYDPLAFENMGHSPFAAVEASPRKQQMSSREREHRRVYGDALPYFPEVVPILDRNGAAQFDELGRLIVRYE